VVGPFVDHARITGRIRDECPDPKGC
jgi:hypothetical protein